jgi:hypothetical protein
MCIFERVEPIEEGRRLCKCQSSQVPNLSAEVRCLVSNQLKDVGRRGGGVCWGVKSEFVFIWRGVQMYSVRSMA